MASPFRATLDRFTRPGEKRARIACSDVRLPVPLAAEIAAARVAGRLSRLVGTGGGTTVPGKLLWKLDPGAVDRLAARLPLGAAVISATNGKTTSAAMAARILGSRIRLAHNSSGANLLSGVASTLLEARSAELGLFEVDEAALPEVIARVRPRAVCLGNLFRDQLDRYGQVELAGLDGVTFTLETPEGARELRLAVPGLYNVYNALAAASLARALGASLEQVVSGLERFGAAFGRFERITVGDRRLLMLLIKNPAGANEAIRTIADAGVPSLAVVALNDGIADGRDVSWIWDVDFEPLIGGLERLVATGDRAAELALRFKYGGMDPDAIEVVPSLERALDRGLELTPAGDELLVLPTYTAMLALRKIVSSRGFVRPYWERAA